MKYLSKIFGYVGMVLEIIPLFKSAFKMWQKYKADQRKKKTKDKQVKRKNITDQMTRDESDERLKNLHDNLHNHGVQDE